MVSDFLCFLVFPSNATYDNTDQDYKSNCSTNCCLKSYICLGVDGVLIVAVSEVVEVEAVSVVVLPLVDIRVVGNHKLEVGRLVVHVEWSISLKSAGVEILMHVVSVLGYSLVLAVEESAGWL